MLAKLSRYTVYPFNPGEGTDRLTAPSTVFCNSVRTDASEDISISEGSSTFTKPPSEPRSDVPSNSSVPTSSSTKPPLKPRSEVSSGGSSSFLSDILTYPKAAITQKKRRGRPGLTTKATCLTDADFLQGLKDQEEQKREKAAEKEARKKRLEKMLLTSLKRKGRKPKTRRGKAEKPTATRCSTDSEEDECPTSEEGSTCTCPTCGLVYGEDGSTWICCDLCNSWFDLKCTDVDAEHIPQSFFCEDCIIFFTCRRVHEHFKLYHLY